MENITSQRNREKFYENGFLYVFDKLSADEKTEFWRCEQKRHCKARVHIVNREVVKTINMHSHEPSAAKVSADKIVTKIKKRALETQESTCQVINECTQNTDVACQGALPNQQALKKLIRRKRNEIHQAPSNPTNLADLEIPECYKTYESEPGKTENFLLADSGPGVDRILIFGRQRNLEIALICDDFFMDGTFKIAPNLFKQIYVVLTKKFGGVHPIFYALLPNKCRVTYDKLFGMIKVLLPNLDPKSITCDYEMAAFKSISEIFPTAEIRGCFFHLVKNMKKKLCELGLTNRYNNEPNFSLYAKMVTALAFVPIEDIDNALLSLSENLPDDVQPILDWFEDSYVGRMNRRGNERRQPLFPHEMWNVFNRTLNQQDRTNNHAEAAHRRLQTELSMDHPTIWKLIDGLRKVQANRDFYYEHLVAGHNPPVKLKKYRDADQRILTIVRDYHSRDIVEYLRGIAHNYQMNL